MKEIPLKAGNPKKLELEYRYSRVIRHDAILPAIALLKRPISTVIVTEYCKGVDLFETVCNNGSFDSLTASKVLFPIADALRALHKKKIIHGDIKPENIMVKDRENLLLGDFGAATKIMPGTKLQGFRGTIVAAAPEVLAKQPYDLKADCWSLAFTIYFSIFGNFPYHVNEDENSYGLIDFIELAESLENPEIDDNLKELFDNAFEIDPEKRWSMEQICNCKWFQSETKIVNKTVDIFEKVKQSLDFIDMPQV